jgi:hypothetical protein
MGGNLSNRKDYRRIPASLTGEDDSQLSFPDN